MNSEEEIRTQITSGTDEDGARKAAELWRHDPESRPILLKLTMDKQWRVRERLAVAFGQLGRSSEIIEALSERLVWDSGPDVRMAAAQALLKVAPLTQVLVLLDRFVGTLQRFPGSDVCLHALLLLAGERSPGYALAAFRGMPQASRQDFLYNLVRASENGQAHALAVIQQAWWHLSHAERQALEVFHFDRYFRHFYYDFYGRTRRPPASEEDASLLLGSVLRFPSLGGMISATSLEELTSLRLHDVIAYEEIPLLRWRALMELATTRQGIPIAEILQQADLHLGVQALLELEDQYDRAREEIALLRERLRHLLEESTSRFPYETSEASQFRESAATVIHQIGEEIEALSGQLDGQGEGPFPTLRRVTARLLPMLRERGVSFGQQLEVEGVLGEYDFVERKITLYTPMVELAAHDLAHTFPKLGPAGDLIGMLSTIVDMHETAHANLHLGTDSDGMHWTKLTSAPVALHEGLAQFYTRALIKRNGTQKLLEVFELLSTKQPEDYQLWSVLGLKQAKALAFAGERSGR